MAVLVRSAHWWESKVPPLLAVAYAHILVHSLSASRALPAVVALATSVALLASYAHSVNDTFDVECDTRAGKENSVAGLTRIGRVARSALLGVAGLVPWLWYRPGGLALAALVAIVVLPLAYSAPPIRLKERGAAGLVTDAAMAHGAPTLFVSLVFADLASRPHSTTAALVVLATAWSFCVGLRGILVHQIQDVRNDELGGVRTYVVGSGVDRARALCSRVLFPAEACLIAALLVALARVHAGVAAVCVIYSVVFQIARRFWALAQEPAPVDPRMRIALFEFYVVWPPLLLALALAARRPVFLVLVVAHALLFGAAVDRQLRGIVSRVGPFIWRSGSTALHALGLRR